jgi:flagellar basal-body rod protein FlgB
MLPMDITQIPLFAMLRGRLSYLDERQRLVAQNVANGDTPGYLPKDLKAFSFDVRVQALRAPEGGAGQGPVTTQPGHISPPRAAGARTFKSMTERDSETRLDGNAVVLEEQMMKMSEARMSYDAAIGFYQKSLGLLRLAARAPGR